MVMHEVTRELGTATDTKLDERKISTEWCHIFPEYILCIEVLISYHSVQNWLTANFRIVFANVESNHF